MLNLPPLSLYMHLPWCERKCPYCDFNSYQREATLPEAEYVERLLLDLEADLPLAQNRDIISIFIGGGTPSLFSGAAIERLLDGVRDQVVVADGAEITLEANPGSAEGMKFRAFHEAGVNRLSIGVQSFVEANLRALGRVHDVREAHAAVAAARAAGFDNINLDLMHGLPGQSPSMALGDLEHAMRHEVSHISWYQLTIEPNTVFHSRPPLLPVDDVLAEIQDRGQELLAREGYRQYEISAYARENRCSEHNLNYWRFGDYLGIGAGAHGKITACSDHSVLRTWKTRSPKDYLNATAMAVRDQRAVSPEELPLEYLMNALRLCEGGTVAEFEGRTGLGVAAIAATLARLRHEGLLTNTPDRLCATALGFRFLNAVLERFT